MCEEQLGDAEFCGKQSLVEMLKKNANQMKCLLAFVPNSDEVTFDKCVFFVGWAECLTKFNIKTVRFYHSDAQMIDDGRQAAIIMEHHLYCSFIHTMQSEIWFIVGKYMLCAQKKRKSANK